MPVTGNNFLHIIFRYLNLQIVFVANGSYQSHFKKIANDCNVENRVALCDYDEKIAHLAYGASDFVLMLSRFEPAGLPQMIGPIYGTLPVVHDTGGIHNAIRHLELEKNTGNGFVFTRFDATGLSEAIDQAVKFFSLPVPQKASHIKRIMTEGAKKYNFSETATQYIELYKKMMAHPLII